MSWLDRFTARGQARRRLRRAVALGPETVEGTFVIAGGIVRVLSEVLVAPLIGTTCVAYRARAEVQLVKGGSMLPPDATRLVPFALACDGGDTVIVDGGHALFDVPWQTPTDDDRGRTFLAMHGATSQTVATSSFEELAIVPGDRVEVAGVLIREAAQTPSHADRTYRAEQAFVARLTGSDAHPIVIRRV